MIHVLNLLKRSELSLALFERALAIRLKTLGPDDADTRSVMASCERTVSAAARARPQMLESRMKSTKYARF